MLYDSTYITYENRPNEILVLEVGITVSFGQEGGWKLARGMLAEHPRC